VLAAIAVVVGISGAIAFADLENQQRGGEAGVFTSKSDRIRLVVPRAWFATDQPSYPGVLLWMMHEQPEAHIVLTAEPFSRRLYCSWPVACRTSHDTLQNKLACSLATKLKNQKMRVGPIQAGPRENEAAGMPSVWFEYDDGKRYLRQAVSLTEDRVVSLVLSTSSTEARTSYVRAFEQALRTLRPLTAEETVPQAGETADAGVVVEADGGALADAAPAQPPAGTAVQTAPTPKINPVGDCSQFH
jgi:hypothetical protein